MKKYERKKKELSGRELLTKEEELEAEINELSKATELQHDQLMLLYKAFARCASNENYFTLTDFRYIYYV